MHRCINTSLCDELRCQCSAVILVTIGLDFYSNCVVQLCQNVYWNTELFPDDQ